MARVDMRENNTGTVDWQRAGEQAVRAYCGWHITPVVEETITLDNLHGGRTLQLPTLAVESISKIEQVDAVGRWATIPADAYRWSRSGLVELRNTIGGFACGVACIKVTLTHGYSNDEVEDVLAIVANVSKRASMELGAISSQSVNGASVSYATAGGSVVSTPLLQIEKQALAPYRLNVGTIGG